MCSQMSIIFTRVVQSIPSEWDYNELGLIEHVPTRAPVAVPGILSCEHVLIDEHYLY